MVSLKKYVACKCGQNNSFDFTSDMAIEDIAVTARCSSCGATIHISVSAMLSPSQPSVPSIASPSDVQQAISEPSEKEVKENVEQAVRDLFR
jgi:transcription elongation factor Elf1